jgi:crooked neck
VVIEKEWYLFFRMKWEPIEEAWMAYIKFENRYKEYERARDIFRRFVQTFPIPKNFIKYAKFEESRGDIETARAIYEQCVSDLEEQCDQNVFVSFAKFEARQKEIERARAIYSYALEKLPLTEQGNLYNVYTQFEKQFGSKDGVEEVIVSKRRLKYEQVLFFDSGA